MDQSLEEEKIGSDDCRLSSEAELSQGFRQNLKIGGDSEETVDVAEQEEGNGVVEESGEEEEDEDEEEEFSFMCVEANSSPIAAEDAFVNGQIRPIFPLFSSGDSSALSDNLPMKPPVEKVFVETTGGDASENDGDWSTRKAVEASPEVCRKSNSTGFSKIWRFKDFLGRSNSDGRDAFVFLTNAEQPPPAKVNTGKGTKKKKSKTTPLSAHEAYLQSKAKDEGRRRSYLPYRPELMGFFTNVNGGLTKNVHPF